MEALEERVYRGLPLPHPDDKGAYRLARPVAVVDREGELVRQQRLLHARQRLGGLAQEHALACAIARHAPAGEVVGPRIAHVLHDAGVDVAQIDERLGKQAWLAWPIQRL